MLTLVSRRGYAGSLHVPVSSRAGPGDTGRGCSTACSCQVMLGVTEETQVKTLLAAKDYAWQGELGQAGKGRRYDVFHYTFPSHLLEEVMKQVAPQ
eukprot:760222-Hanusia_phi.AAC.1